MKIKFNKRRSGWLATSSIAFLAVSPICNLAAQESAPIPEQTPGIREPDPKEIEFFEKKIRPLLVENCYVCHSEHHKEAGGLRVDDFRALTIQGRNGIAIVPGDSSKSLLIKRVTDPDDNKIMPPDHRLSDEQIQDLKTWIDRGAAWPPLVIPKDIDQSFEPGHVPHADLKEGHWAWQPLVKAPVPDLSNTEIGSQWAKNEVDSFVAAKLAEVDLRPVGDANKRVLLRRLTYDLTGLPPTQEELVAFLLDDSENAVETVVDRLLASEAFGERWGRHWLDVARYGESTGSARNLPYPHAWRYRNYVVQSFNQDKPFNEFLREQIAGDLLESDSDQKKFEQLVATGFLALGVKDVNQRFKVRYEMDNVDEQIDTVSRAVLGLTVSCARCHDHKFDPISTRDYYAFAGIFTSTEHHDALRNLMGGGGLAYYVPERLIPLYDADKGQISPEQQTKIDAKKAEYEEARVAFVTVRDSVKAADRTAEHTRKLQQARQAMNRKQAELVSLSDPAALGPVALGVRDGKEIGDTEIRIRGEAEKRGPKVPRGFLTLLDHIHTPAIPDNQSGRLQLADWLTQDSNPLTSRVIVNRIWTHLFSEGIVRTVDNFGSTGDLPTHPELLDFLANKFVHDGWSHKKFIRYLVLSRTYQLSSQGTANAFAKDPSNKYLWRHAPRRLAAEEIRDSVLAVSGNLKRGAIAEPASSDLPVIEIRNNGAEARKLIEASAASQHRSLYLPMVRGILHDVLQVFDFAEQGMVTGRRTNTTVAPQALFLLNDPFIRRNALSFATELIQTAPDKADQQIVLAYRKVLQRQPDALELARAVAFLHEYQSQFTNIHEGSPQDESSTPVDAPKLAAAKLVSQTTPPSATPEKAEEVAATNDAAPEDSRGVEAKVEISTDGLTASNSQEAALSALLHSLFSSAEFRYVR